MKISTFLNVNWLYGHLNALNIRRTKCINERERFPVSQIRYLIGKLCNCLFIRCSDVLCGMQRTIMLYVLTESVECNPVKHRCVRTRKKDRLNKSGLEVVYNTIKPICVCVASLCGLEMKH